MKRNKIVQVSELIWTGGDCHIYNNHFDQVKEQITRTPRALPHLLMPVFNNLDELLETTTSEYKLISYDPMPSIKAPMAV